MFLPLSGNHTNRGGNTDSRYFSLYDNGHARVTLLPAMRNLPQFPLESVA